MAIRISGMNSGLDTDSIVSALVMNYQTKVDKNKKAQQKLSWKQDAWKSVNTQVNSLYSKAGALRFTSAYTSKRATVSDTSKAKVTAGTNALSGTQKLKVSKLATTGYITGGELGEDTTGSTKLSALLGDGESLSGTGKITVNTAKGSTDIDVTADTTVDDFVKKLNDAGVKASFDSENQRIFISANESGAENDFSLTGGNSDGLLALTRFGVNAPSTAAMAEYRQLANVYNGGVDTADEVEAELTTLKNAWNARTNAANDNETAKGLLSYAKTWQTVYGSTGDDDQDTARSSLREFLANNSDVDSYTDEEKEQFESLAVDAGLMTKDGEGNVTDRSGLDSFVNAYKAIEGYKNTISDAEAALGEGEELSAANQNLKSILETMDGHTGDIDDYVTTLENRISTNDTTIADNDATIESLDYYGIGSEIMGMTDDEFNAAVSESLEKLETAAGIVNGTGSNSSNYSSGAVRVDGQDAEIYLNDAKFTSDTNSFSINGLTIEALEETGNSEVTINTASDVDGLYDKIKDFLSSYNDTINSLTKQYNASSAKGYEPLTDDEKASMTDTQIEKWEEKIKDSLLRRDGTLDSIINTMTSSMFATTTDSNGKSMSLASLGIHTLGLNAAENENHAYHIDGDEDDSNTSTATDKLREALNSDPDSVVELMKKISSNLYEKLGDKMKSTSLRSAYTVYNDKEMKTEYSSYTKTIKNWEDRLEEMQDKYYKQFTAMEKALATLNSNTSALTGLMG